ncbi:MAG: DUF2971 domain-containing protein [Gammaproteobacteria bacterium]|nr:DUF2971 domain-containing protein [Gammaproteobacteria bacterium]
MDMTIRTAPLFKYTSAKVAETIVKNATIRYSSPVLFDDPLDVARSFDLGFPLEKLEAALVEEILKFIEKPDLRLMNLNPLFYLLGILFINGVPKESIERFKNELPALIREGTQSSQKYLDELNRIWKELVPQMRILCFSDKKDIMPLWATYGDTHKGAVLEFLPQETTDSPWLLANPVQYSDEKMLIATPKEWARSILGVERIDYKKIFERYGNVKTTNWSYQEEVRVFSFKRASDTGMYTDYKFSPLDLRAINFGYQTNKSDMQNVVNLLINDFEHVEAYQLAINSESRKIIYNKVK